MAANIMGRSVRLGLLLAGLIPLALWSLHWGTTQAIVDSADLERRAEEVRLFQAGDDPYRDPDLTYPPSALPVFTALLAGVDGPELPRSWLALNLVAVGALGWTLIAVYGRDWPGWLRLAFLLALAASRPVRAGLALGQYHALPTALMIGAWVIAIRTRGASQTDSEPATAGGIANRLGVGPGCFRRGDGFAGILLALAAIKPTMVLPFFGAWLLCWGPAALLVAGLAQLALWAGAAVWLGVSPVRLGLEWLANARTQEAAGTVDLPSLLAHTPLGIELSASSITLLVLLAGLLLMACLPRHDAGALAALGALLGAVFAYHRHYDLVLLLPALAWLIEQARGAIGPRGRRTRAAVWLFGLMLILPSHPAPLRRFAPLYEAAFVAVTYGVLVLIVVHLARRPGSGVQECQNPEVAGATLGVES